jgi:hypothetical protein
MLWMSCHIMVLMVDLRSNFLGSRVGRGIYLRHLPTHCETLFHEDFRSVAAWGQLITVIAAKRTYLLCATAVLN